MSNNIVKSTQKNNKNNPPSTRKPGLENVLNIHPNKTRREIKYKSGNKEKQYKRKRIMRVPSRLTNSIPTRFGRTAFLCPSCQNEAIVIFTTELLIQLYLYSTATKGTNTLAKRHI